MAAGDMLSSEGLGDSQGRNIRPTERLEGNGLEHGQPCSLERDLRAEACQRRAPSERQKTFVEHSLRRVVEMLFSGNFAKVFGRPKLAGLFGERESQVL